ncbi:hypothetical protein EJ110_NYTH18782 [Nymphaea thermarum]|nr:hypothetical protein EJ110_NYTH18782 [Nymphaea thermarum]
MKSSLKKIIVVGGRSRGTTDKNEIFRFFMKRSETRRSENGYWKQVGGPETVTHPNGRQVFAIKTVFRFFLEQRDIETDWFVTEFAVDEFYRVLHNIPKEPADS